jgi:gas vesicle protein
MTTGEYTENWVKLIAFPTQQTRLILEKIIMDKNGLSAFLLGLGVGVGIGMLFAPKSGPETRQFIKEKAGESSDYLKQRGEELRDTASGWVDKGKDALGRQKETLADAMEAGKQAYRDVVSGSGSSQEGLAR